MTSKEKLLRMAVDGTGGKDWYKTANTVIHQFCFTHDIDPERFIKVLAVLSPKVSVLQNLHLAIGWCFFGLRPRVVRSVEVSFQRLIDSGYQRSAIRGPKTSRFCDALMGDPDVVVLDTHMGYVLKVPANRLRNKSVQKEAERRIGWAAWVLDWTPAQVQAAIWAAQRHQAGYNYVAIERSILDKAHARHRTSNPF